MAENFNRERFIKDLEKATAETDDAAALGARLGEWDFKRLFFVACGAPNCAMAVPHYWGQRVARNLEVRRYFPAEFVHQNPAALDRHTLVILSSKSGTTKETVQAAEFLQNTPCTTVGITQKADSPLVTLVRHRLLYGETGQAYYAGYILLQALTSGLFNAVGVWPIHDQVMSSLNALPGSMADAIEANEARAAEDARLYKDDRILYIVAAGPVFGTARAIGICILMEMQWMHVHPLVAAEFFHGPFEVVDETTPLILLVGEDPSRPEAERVVRFCRKITERLMVYDSTEFEMRGIDRQVRPIVAPFVVDAALSRMADHLAVWHNHPLSTRRYMGKMEV